MAAADYTPSLNSLPDQMAGHSGLLVGGQGEVGEVVGGTLRLSWPRSGPSSIGTTSS